MDRMTPPSQGTSDTPGLLRSIGRSIFPNLRRLPDDRGGYRALFNSLMLHFRPRKVPERTLRFTLTWGLGGMALVLVTLLFGSGVLLKFVYQPIPEKAYESVLRLQNDVSFGQLIRNVHHWSGKGLLIVTVLHLIRVFFTGAFHPPRQFNWIIGLGLMAAVLFSNFTGYLLPWDQLAFWAVTVGTGMLEYLPGIGGWLQRLILGGPELGANTLSTFYAIHTAILPGLLAVLLSFHFWRVRKAGGLVVPRESQEDTQTRGPTVEAIPHLILREVTVGLTCVACVLLFSVMFDAPLGGKANPGLSPNPTKAPWYFVGIQEMLLHFHPFFALFVLPVLGGTALLAIPYLRYETDTAGVWFASVKGRRMGLVAAVVAAVTTPLGVLADEYLAAWATWMAGIPGEISQGLIPVTLLLGGLAGFGTAMRRQYRANKNEAVQMAFVFLMVAFVLLTVIGIWFRGPGMKLVWPWQA
jgi:quinol-cytochrome oxidoreductase complex cytochrome b subunit